MKNFLFDKIIPAIFTAIKPLVKTSPQVIALKDVLNKIHAKAAINEFLDSPPVEYIMPAIMHTAGPVMEDGASVFNDINGDGRWILPHFTLKNPLEGGFLFLCKKEGKTSDSSGSIIDNYTGAITINLATDVPPPGKEISDTTDKIIPLENLSIVLNFKLANNQVLTYQPVVSVTEGNCLLAFDAVDLGVLTNLYKIFSDPTSAPFCSLDIKATYWGFKKKEDVPELIKYRHFIRRNANINLHNNAGRLSGKRLLINSRAIKDIKAFQNGDNSVMDTPQEAEPQGDDANQYDYESSIPFTAAIPLGFDCNTYPNNYIFTDGDSNTTFGCNPPFDANSVRKHTYSPFSILTGSLTDRHYGISAIYRNQLNNNYLLIPEQYLIALEDPSETGQLVPSAYLNTTIDINDANGINTSTANFKFNVGPNLSAWQIRQIKQLIVQNLPQNLNKTINDIYIEYPQTLDDVENQHLFAGHNIAGVQAVNLGMSANEASKLNTFHIEFKQVPINDGSAATLAGSLKTTGTALVDKFTWKIDAPAGNSIQSAVMLSLLEVTGEGIKYSVDLAAGSSYLTNNTLYDVTIDAYTNGSQVIEVNPVAVIGGNNIIDITALSFDQPITNVSDLRYSYKANPDYIKQVLKELRFNADQVDDDIIVTNNTGLFTRFNIKQIDFFISIAKAGETDPENVLTSATKTITQDGVINHVPFVLPVAAYLSNWSAIYYTTISFNDDTTPLTTNPVLIDDINSIGKVINLTAALLKLS